MKKLNILILLLSVVVCTAQQSKQPASVNKVEEKLLIELGGEKQYVEITGESDKNPVLLFIHGGPGWTQTPQLRYFNADLTKDFTLVAWEQRGTGKSFMNNPEPKNVTLEQIVADGHELTQKLKEKFRQNKIYLVGYSWGSIVGVHLAQKFPNDYQAYIGIAQVINMKKSMNISQKWLYDRAKEKGDKVTLQALEKLKKPTTDFCNGDLQCFIKQYELVTKYDGAIYNKDTNAENEKATTKYEDYKDYDWMKAFEFSAKNLEKDMFATDFRNVKELKLPVYFFLGRHDWNVSATLAAEFAKNLKAPKKKVVWFENSGHSLLEEEPQKFNKTMRSIISQ